MEKTQSHHNSAGQIDSPILWVAVRGGEILYAAILAKMAYLNRGTESVLENVMSTACLLLVLILYLNRVVTGWADSEGIHYRRYFRWKTLAWPDVQDIQWKGALLRVLVRGKKRPKAVLAFLLNPLNALGPYWAQRLGTDVEPPAIFKRINALPIESPPPMSTVPSRSRFRWLLFWVSILLLAIMLMRMLSAAS
jgi:hypothetical protein